MAASHLDPSYGLEPFDLATALAASTSTTEWAPQSRAERETARRQEEELTKARKDKEEAQVVTATDESLKDFERGLTKDKSRTSPPRIDRRIDAMAAKLEHELAFINDPNGDTLVYIDPPTQSSSVGDEAYESYIERYNQPFYVRSDSLLGLNSSFFARQFSSTNQYRVIRRRGLANNLPSGIKFVVDLTPPSEGDDAVYLTTELCCSQGVLKWYKANKRWGVSKSLVGGPEEYIQYSADDQEQPLTLEYTPLRHRAAIERVLLAVHGHNPQISSAPQMWTTFAVAKYFDITHSPLTDWIISWLRAHPNTYFIEVLPEVALKVADGLQCEQLCRDTFAILVGEEALGNIRRCRGGAPKVGWSVHGRKQDDLPEIYQTRVEYASKAFLERISTIVRNLVGAKMDWLAEVLEFQKLLSINQPDIANSEILISLQDKLKAYVRGAIYKAMCANFLQAPNEGGSMYGDDDLYPTLTWRATYNRLIPRERLMTRTFWRVLSKQDIVRGSSNLDINHQMLNSTHIPDPEPTAAEESMLSGGVFTKVYKAELETAALKLNAILENHQTPATGHRHLASDVPISNCSDIVINVYDDNFCFEVNNFLNQVRAHILRLCSDMLESDESPLDLGLTDTLICLEETEWKYLPIWANGNDDGTGGVFDDEVPFADGGFSTAGPDVHNGSGTSLASSDGYEFVGSRSTDSTHHTSTIVNDGGSSILHPLRTYAMSDGGESWDTVNTGHHGLGAGLQTISVNTPSSNTRSTASASDFEQVVSLDGDDMDGEARADWELVRENAAIESAVDQEGEDEVSNAFLDDDDSSTTELGDPFSDNEVIDDSMEDEEDQTENGDTVIV